jgi:hypothetical protein
VTRSLLEDTAAHERLCDEGARVVNEVLHDGAKVCTDDADLCEARGLC